jgi:hypothetical protein
MQSEYFVLERAANNEHPLLGWAQRSGVFYKGKAVNVTEPLKLRLGAPVPPKPVMVDHHSLPKPVVSTRVKEVLESLELHQVQLVPADVKVSEEDVRRYWLVHVFNRIPALDREQSVVEWVSEEDGLIFAIEKLVLKKKVLEELPLSQRQVFVLEEHSSMYLVHQSVVDRVMALQPMVEGFRFIPVERWNSSVPFS